MSVNKILACFASVALLACTIAISAAAADFDTANKAFDQSDFTGAKRNYEELIARGDRSANLFYNLGNTEFRLGLPGPAILDYERALILEPSHPEAQRNIALLREKTRSRLRPQQWYDAVFPAWRANVFIGLCAVTGWLVVLSFSFAAFRGQRAAGVWWLGVLSLFVAAYAAAGCWYTGQRNAMAIVIEKEGVARLAPAEQSAVAGTLPAGSQVRILSERGEWVYCELPGEGLGWLPAKSVERVRLPS